MFVDAKVLMLLSLTFESNSFKINSGIEIE